MNKQTFTFCAARNKQLIATLWLPDGDPVGDMGKGVKAVQKQFVKTGIQQVDCVLLPDARHDLLHEEKSGAAKQARACILRFLCEVDK